MTRSEQSKYLYVYFVETCPRFHKKIICLIVTLGAFSYYYSYLLTCKNNYNLPNEVKKKNNELYIFVYKMRLLHYDCYLCLQTSFPQFGQMKDFGLPEYLSTTNADYC